MLEKPSGDFKMPKTPARKKRGQQKKRGLTFDEGKSVYYWLNIVVFRNTFIPLLSLDHLSDQQVSDVPSKRGKLSSEDDELRESVGGRPKRQASSVNFISLIPNLDVITI